MPRILIVDDDPLVRETLHAFLEDAGYTVVSAVDGYEAAELLSTEPPDLLVTDVVMPGLVGWSLLARARRIKPDLPVLLLSGIQSAPSGQHDGSLAPRTVFLRKPCDFDQLEAAIARLVA